MKRWTWVWLTVGGVAAVPGNIAAQVTTERETPVDLSATAFELSVANVMLGPEHVGDAPSAVRWSDDGEWVFFRWKPGGLAWDEPTAQYRVRAEGGEPERLSDAAADSLGVLIAPGPSSEDDRWRAVASDGDLYLIDRRSLRVRQLTATRASESTPVFSRDGSALYFVREGDVFRLALGDGMVRQVTDVRSGPAPTEPDGPTGQRGFLTEQQATLFEHVRRRVAEREREEARDSAERERAPLKPVYLERNERTAGVTIEPDGRYAMLITDVDNDDSDRRTVIPEWVTESGYTETREVRTKVGDAQSSGGRAGVLSITDGSVQWLDVEAAAAAIAEDTAKRPGPSGVRFLGWNEDGTAGLIGAASNDFKDAWLWTFDARSGELKLVTHHQDDAWVAGPCAFWFGCAGWLPDGRTVYFVSERDGYAHLYTAATDGSARRQLTSGPWEVHSVEVSPDRDRFYLQTNEGTPHEQHFYHMAFDGGGRERITTMPGRQDATPSPDGQRIAFVHSVANQPPDLFIADNRASAAPRRVTTSPTEEWRSFPWIAPEIVHVVANDGVRVPARIYRPEQLGAEPNGAGVIFVHGAGYLQNVHNWWSSYYREYMFHHLLAARGYVVLD
ncbi:MAG: DPP IV N-terminal domain-containing protein, partial [Longimicrobiales bacterium]